MCSPFLGLHIYVLFSFVMYNSETGKDLLRDKKKQLLDKENELRDEKKQLLDEKKQLRDKEKQLRDIEKQLRNEKNKRIDGWKLLLERQLHEG